MKDYDFWRVASVLACAVVGSTALSLAHPEAAAAQQAADRFEFEFRREDVRTAAGAAAAYARLAREARRFCAAGSTEVLRVREERRCTRQVIDATVAKIGEPQLARARAWSFVGAWFPTRARRLARAGE